MAINAPVWLRIRMDIGCRSDSFVWFFDLAEGSLKRLISARQAPLAWTVADRFPGTQLELLNCLECETCSPGLEGQWTVRIVLAHLLAQPISCCVKCRRRSGALSRRGGGVVIEPQLISTALSMWPTVAHSRLVQWPQKTDVWIGLTTDDDVYL